jgi:hypothetical protein
MPRSRYEGIRLKTMLTQCSETWNESVRLKCMECSSDILYSYSADLEITCALQHRTTRISNHFNPIHVFRTHFFNLKM